MNFGENLQKLRKEKGLSQEKLAEILEVSRQAISKWESNAAYPEIEKLISLSNLFNVSIDYLVKGKESKNEVDCKNSSEVLKSGNIIHNEHIVSKHQYSYMRTALAIMLYAISPFWFNLLGELPGSSGKGVFLMFLSIAIATGLLLYNHLVKHHEGEK
ncbi:MAG: helix-turn-helix domain-containing protein [Clostridia bacterium]|jgi:transcriptional regulator with XRE-family HTH domain|nr:helix-turn-helix domain-containing protein [Clostridia bacterium]